MAMEQRLVVVTGASKGVGRQTVMALVRDHGCSVIAISRDAGALASLQKETAAFGGRVSTLPLDIASPEAAAKVKAAVAGYRLHALVHNAGMLRKKSLGQYLQADLQEIYAVNVFAPLLISQALLDELDGDPPGHILHIASMGGFQDSVKFSGLVGYSSSKAAVACMAQCLAEELKDRRIRSNSLALGSVDTEMVRAAFPGYVPATTAEAMGDYVARFALQGHNLFNGKVLPVASTTP